jgi:hypothetical protein
MRVRVDEALSMYITPTGVLINEDDTDIAITVSHQQMLNMAALYQSQMFVMGDARDDTDAS